MAPVTPSRQLRGSCLVSVAIALLAGCGASRAATVGPASLATVAQQYLAAVEPANKALTGIQQQASAYTGGSMAALVSTVPTTRGALKTATGRLRAIQAPAPVSGDIEAVVAAADAVDTDLVALGSGSSGNAAAVESEVAKLVADIGGESAADRAVRFTLQLLANPAAPSSSPTAPESTVAETTTTSTVAKPARTTTSVRAGTATTRGRTTSTRKP